MWLQSRKAVTAESRARGLEDQATSEKNFTDFYDCLHVINTFFFTNSQEHNHQKSSFSPDLEPYFPVPIVTHYLNCNIRNIHDKRLVHSSPAQGEHLPPGKVHSNPLVPQQAGIQLLPGPASILLALVGHECMSQIVGYLWWSCVHTGTDRAIYPESSSGSKLLEEVEKIFLSGFWWKILHYEAPAPRGGWWSRWR